MKALILAAVLTVPLSLSAVSAAPYTSIDLSSNYNWDSTVFGTPTGQQTFGGVPFNIPVVGGLNAYTTFYETQNGVTNTQISNIGIYGATTVYTLLNNIWGSTGLTNGYVTINGTNGVTYQYNLTAGANVRDHLLGGYSDSLTDPSAQQVFSYTAGNNNVYRIDMQTIVLPSSFATETLTDIIIHSSNIQGAWGLALEGITVASSEIAVPEPASIAILLAGIFGLGVTARRKYPQSAA